MKEYTQVTFDIDPQQHEVLTAFLSEFPFETFTEEEGKLYAYIPTETFDRHQLESYLQSFPRFASVQPSYTAYRPKNWNEEWQKNFQPIAIDDKIVVRAPFHDKDEEVDYDILIEPRMSFGTGHHATTALMLRLMYQNDFHHQYVVDFGCGTGILAIFAAMKGAHPIVAFDNNEWAYNNAPLNCQLNNIDQVEVTLAGEEELHNHRPQVILANINRNILVNNMSLMAGQLQHTGALYLSGILIRDQQEVDDAATAEGLRKVAVEEDGEWLALQYEKP